MGTCAATGRVQTTADLDACARCCLCCGQAEAPSIGRVSTDGRRQRERDERAGPEAAVAGCWRDRGPLERATAGWESTEEEP